MRRGDAEISTQHANFIINHGHASARDVYDLIVAAQTLVWKHNRIWIHPEIELFGRWSGEERSRLLLKETAS
jgi:UDP-N-acetylmuramate dehydrogenase